VRRLFRRAAALYEKHAVAIDLLLVTAGAAAVKRRIEAIHGRLAELEERGLVPLDDLVTVRDVAKIDRRVWVLEGEPGPDPAAVFDQQPAGELEEEPAPAETGEE
jgi:hypothetical protein